MKIILSTVMAFFLLACSQNEKETTQQSNTTEVNTVEKITQTEQTTQEKPQEIVKDTNPQVQIPTQETNTTAVQTQKSEESPKIDGATIYKVCASCHGQNGEKQALNKSQIIQGWESSKTVAALQGYKDGTYGGPMKAMMKGQVTKLSDAEMKAVANYISDL